MGIDRVVAHQQDQSNPFTWTASDTESISILIERLPWNKAPDSIIREISACVLLSKKEVEFELAPKGASSYRQPVCSAETRNGHSTCAFPATTKHRPSLSSAWICRSLPNWPSSLL